LTKKVENPNFWHNINVVIGRSTESNEAMLTKLTAMLDVPTPTPPELILPPLPAVSPQNDEIENVIGLVRASLNRILKRPLLKRRTCILELLSFLYSREEFYEEKK